MKNYNYHLKINNYDNYYYYLLFRLSRGINVINNFLAAFLTHFATIQRRPDVNPVLVFPFYSRQFLNSDGQVSKVH